MRFWAVFLPIPVEIDHLPSQDQNQTHGNPSSNEKINPVCVCFVLFFAAELHEELVVDMSADSTTVAIGEEKYVGTANATDAVITFTLPTLR